MAAMMTIAMQIDKPSKIPINPNWYTPNPMETIAAATKI
jgi:hypothetical protein